jgi:branched-chain amino acid transport system ATP-binding protein
MLDVERVVSGYGRLEVLHGIDIHVPPGRVVGLLGANGAGKTTLVNTIMGLVTMRAGSIRFEGEAIGNLRSHAIVRRGLTMVPQGREIFGGMTVRENLDVAGLGAPPGVPAARLLEQQLGTFPALRKLLDQRAQTLSGGEQQMLAIARALMLRPKLLMLDEPTMGLAPRVINDLARVIRSLNAQGQTILLVEQNLGLVLATTDLVYVLRNGQKVFEGAPRSLKDDRDMLRLYLE